MKVILFGSVVGVLLASSVVRAAVPSDTECASAGPAAEQLKSGGNLSAARARLAACLSPECSSRVRQECARQMGAVVAAMPAVVLEAKDEASNNMTAVRVKMDGAPMLDRLDGSAFLVNPGEHRVTFEAAGFRTTAATFVAREPQKKLRVVVFLASSPTAAPDQLMIAPPASAQIPHDEPIRVPTRRRYVALALGGAGIGAAAVGTIWAIMSKVKYDHALSTECAGDRSRCSAQGVADGRAAHDEATVATVGFAAAGALLAAGAVVYFTGANPTDVAVAPVVDRGAGLTVVAKW